MPKRMTEADRRARAALIIAESARTGCSTVTAIERVKSRRVFGETAPAALGRSATAAKSPKPSKRAQRIARAVTEALTARGAPSLPPGAATAGKPSAKATRPSVPLHEMSREQLDAGLVAALGQRARSPFWQPEESVTAAAVTETAQHGGKPLHLMSSDELLAHSAATFTAATPEFKSPIWGGTRG